MAQERRALQEREVTPGKTLHPALFHPYRAAFYVFLAARRTLVELSPDRGWRTWITPEILLGGFLVPSDVAELERLGVRAVVNATSELVEPIGTLRAAGMDYLQIPCWDMNAPSPEDADRAIAFVATHIKAGHRVYVHCASGVGRSVTLVVCYLALHRGMSVEEAIAWISARRRVAMREGQRRFVNDYVSARGGRVSAENA
ncbi:protein-tyrosine phosphatase family protein [Polyangium jinanense]|uniref:Dual specificity protein phosphatase family protein n=1 Tax=Polyangium jinanense TaxID=2829994 RepID=A0A9X3X934_9BACT|nr:dual specificity protein phosphatase family protein [Polyangium jinanense]MDC3961139.1 dual specificity protein phosphatase family protein [Polyangium jinanense]MDC3986442.1 dual specificity protein phosphatase family protein [Polyangium jinanense]